jgi:hypothetical protein
MKLSEIFMQLTHGELSQLSLGGSEAGEISEANYPKIVSHVNLALTALYKRFPLKEGQLTVALQAGRSTYPLTSSYAAANRRSRESVKFILDTQAEPFENDIHKIERVYTDTGFELGLNDEADMYSCFTPTATTLRVPLAVVAESADLPQELKTTNLVVVYRANHPPITISLGLFEPERVEVDLPYSHLEPLLYYVASRVNNPTGMTNEFHAGNSYAAKYELSCAELERINLRVDQGSQNTRLERNGWV